MGRQSKQENSFEIVKDGRTINDAKEICSIINDHFIRIGANLASEIGSDRNILRMHTIENHQNSMFLRPTTSNEVIDLINKLDPKKSAGYDNIPVSFIKFHFDVFVPMIVGIFNEIIEPGQYPDSLKIARVIPVFKSGSHKDLNNYRPIATLSIIDKILEKLIVSRTMKYLTRYNILFEHQYGFREGSSTLTASCDLVDRIYDTLDGKQFAGTLFIDLKKAFDTIDHGLLIAKMEAYGIRGSVRKLFESYLMNRKQYVSIGAHKSDMQSIRIGVPQGSNLGPIMFLLFINDLAGLRLIGELRLFADDTCIFYKGFDHETILHNMRQDVTMLLEYFKSNVLSMNLKKTKYMLIHSPRRRIPHHDP